MWPNEMLGRGTAVNCSIGLHRFSAPHAIGSRRNNWLQKCRVCGKTVIMSFDEKDGQITQKTYEIPNKRIVVS